MKKTKTGPKINDIVDCRSPIVKDFIDPDKVVQDFLLLRLAHVSHAFPSPRLVYQSHDKSTYRFRVNWWHEAEIVQSKYYEVKTENGQMQIVDKTI